MNIGFIITSLKAFGGTERIVTLLANQLGTTHKITIINRDTTKENTKFPVESYVDVKVIPGSLFSFCYQLNQYLKAQKFDLVIVNNMGKLSQVVGLLPDNTPKWSYEHSHFTGRPVWVRAISRFIYHRYCKILTITRKDALEYARYGDRAMPVQNPVSYPLYDGYDANSKHIIAVGRLVAEKGFTNLVLAWSLIQKKYPDWSLTIYGDGADRAALEAIIRSKGIKNICLHHAIPNLDDIYKKAAFLVLSSKKEGLGMVLAEAQTFSLPTVAFDCPVGPREIIHHEKDGLLIKNQNIPCLAKGMERLINDRELRQKYSKAAFAAAARFSLANVVSIWEKLLQQESSSYD